MIETMISLAIIGILVNLALPMYTESLLRARVAAVIGDYRAVQTAVSDYYLAHKAWPPDAGPGEQPPELAGYLSDQINWSLPFRYDYDYYADAAGNPTQPESGVLVGFSVRDVDPKLVALIEAAEPALLATTWGDGVTFVIQPADQAPDPAAP
jgi:type II secretory pathway pseudopilin PulG